MGALGGNGGWTADGVARGQRNDWLGAREKTQRGQALRGILRWSRAAPGFPPRPSRQEIVNRGSHTHTQTPTTQRLSRTHRPTTGHSGGRTWARPRTEKAGGVELSFVIPKGGERERIGEAIPESAVRKSQAAEYQAHAALCSSQQATRKRQDVPRRHAAVMCEGISCVRGILARPVGRTGLGYSAVICSLRSPGTPGFWGKRSAGPQVRLGPEPAFKAGW